MYCECGQKLIIIGQIQGGSRMYFCLTCLEVVIKDKWDKVKERFTMDWFLKWHRQKITIKEQIAQLISEDLGIEEVQNGC